MLSSIFNKLTEWFDWLGWLLKMMWKTTVKWVTDAWGLAVILAGVVWTFLQKLGEMMVAVVALIEGIVWPDLNPDAPGPVMSAAALINTFFPLSECMTIAAAYGLLLMALTIFKWVKIMIPGWGNT